MGVGSAEAGSGRSAQVCRAVCDRQATWTQDPTSALTSQASSQPVPAPQEADRVTKICDLWQMARTPEGLRPCSLSCESGLGRDGRSQVPRN